MRDFFPQLDDRLPFTRFDPHYTFQAAWLARKLAGNKPEVHFDVGSDVRMIVVLSAFVETTFLDLRPLNVAGLTGLASKAGDVTKLDQPDGSIQSISCMHVLEHIGLGRYGDPVDPQGFDLGFKELMRVVANGGSLYISVPIGKERTEFNAHRVLSPLNVVKQAVGFELCSFSCVDDDGRLHHDTEPEDCLDLNYGCGLFEFRAVT